MPATLLSRLRLQREVTGDYRRQITVITATAFRRRRNPRYGAASRQRPRRLTQSPRAAQFHQPAWPRRPSGRGAADELDGALVPPRDTDQASTMCFA